MKNLTGKRILAAAIVSAAVLLTGGCVDVVQYISGSGSDIDVYLRFALQKSAFEMANSFSDEPGNLDEMFEGEFDLDRENVLRGLPPGIKASYTPLNTEFEFGFELAYSASRDVLAGLDDTAGAFVPRVGLRGMTIRLAEGRTGEGGGDEFAAAFLGGSKYRVFISRLLVSRVSAARLVTGRGSTEVTIIELPDVWMIQFPVSLWLMSPETPSLEILY